MQPLVSVIMPNYNGVKNISFAIRSVIRQTLDSWELIVVDDGSTDQSLQTIEDFAAQDDRIICLSHGDNRGIASARNTAMARAKGRYLAFLDSDDLWHPEKLQRQVSFMVDSGALISFTRYSVIDEDLHTLRILRAAKEVSYQTLVWQGNPMGCLTVMVDRRIGAFEMPLMDHEDYATWLALMQGGHRALGLDENLAAYRLHRRSVSYQKMNAASWTYRIYRKHLKRSALWSLVHLIAYAVANLTKRIELNKTETERWIVVGHQKTAE